MAQPILVATEKENVVRIYAGSPNNGGMHQTGQFVSHREIEPTDLANMALDLSEQFGWLQVESTTPEPVKQVAPAEPKALTSYKERANDQVNCPTCKHTFKRSSLARHLMKVHKWQKTKAHNMERTAEAVGKHEPTTNVAKPRKASDTDKWKQWVKCPVPECGIVMTRSNLARHLTRQLDGHQVRHTEASAMVRDLPTVPAPHKLTADLNSAGHVNRQGLHGARLLEVEVLPKVLEIVESIGHPVTSVDVAERSGVNTGTALSWLKKLQAQGKLIQTDEGPIVQGMPLHFAIAPKETSVPTLPVPEEGTRVTADPFITSLGEETANVQ